MYDATLERRSPAADRRSFRGYLRILSFARGQWRALAVILALTFLYAAFTALQPWPLKLLIDHGLGAAPLDGPVAALFTWLGIERAPANLILFAALASLLVFAASTALDAVVTFAWSAAGQRMVYGLASSLFLQLHRLSLLFHSRLPTGDALSRITGDSWSVSIVTDALLIAPARHALVIASVGALAWQLDRALSLLMLVTVPALIGSAAVFGEYLKRAGRRRRETVARLTAFVHQVLGAMPIVQAFSAGGRNDGIFAQLAARAASAHRDAAALSTGFTVANAVAIMTGMAVVIYAGGERVLAAELSLGSLVLFTAYMRTLGVAWRGLLRAYGSLRNGQASVERVLEILDAADAVQDLPGARNLPPRRSSTGGHVVFDRVRFGYRPELPVIREVSLELAPGEVVALVGATGAGKTTLASLLLRLFDPWEGSVRLDGMDLRHVRLESLRREISLVLQDPFLLPLTVAENIAYGSPDASMERITAVAAAANADEFIRQLPQGYETVLGEEGATLSGGQQQRLAIARALLKDARLLVLDEPTAALDAATEEAVMEALGRLMAGRTTLLIAHRLATVRRADRIALLEGGRIVELGTHAELLAAGGAYAGLVSFSLSTGRGPLP